MFRYFLIVCLFLLITPKVSDTFASEISYEVKLNSMIREQKRAEFWFNLAIYKLKQFEGFATKPYLGSSGERLIGYGHSMSSRGEYINQITDTDAELLLKTDLTSEIDFIKKDLKRSLIDSSQQIIALAMFSYNVGRGAWNRSRLRSCVISGLPVEGEFLKWVYINEKKSSHLMKRRIFELNLYSKILHLY